MLQCAAVCCSVLQCAVVCCSVLQCASVRYSVLQCAAVCVSSVKDPHLAIAEPSYINCCFGELQWVAVSCSVMQYLGSISTSSHIHNLYEYVYMNM